MRKLIYILFFILTGSTCENDKPDVKPKPTPVFSSLVIDTTMTIERGFELLGSRDTLKLKGGIYRESLYNVIPTGKSLVNFGKDSVIIKPDSGTFVLYIRKRSDIYVKGLILDGTNVDNTILKLTDTAKRNRFNDVELRFSKYNAMLTTNGADSTIFENGYVHDIGDTIKRRGNGFYISTSYNIIRNTKITRVSKNAMVSFNGVKTDTLYGNIFEYNDISLAGQGFKSAAGIALTSGYGHVSRYNYIHDTKYGNVSKYGAMSPEFYGNTYENTHVAFWALNDQSIDSTYREKGATFINNKTDHHLENQVKGWQYREINDGVKLSQFKSFQAAIDSVKLLENRKIIVDTDMTIDTAVVIDNIKNVKLIGRNSPVLTGFGRSMFYVIRSDGFEIKKITLRAKNKLTDIYNRNPKINDPDYNTRIGIQVLHSKNVKVKNNEFKYFYQIATYFVDVDNFEYTGNYTHDMFRDPEIDQIQTTGILVNNMSEKGLIANNKFINIFGLHGNNNCHAVYVGGSKDVTIEKNHCEITYDAVVGEFNGNDIVVYKSTNKGVRVLNNLQIKTTPHYDNANDGYAYGNKYINCFLTVNNWGLVERDTFVINDPRYHTGAGLIRNVSTVNTSEFKDLVFINENPDIIKDATAFMDYRGGDSIHFDGAKLYGMKVGVELKSKGYDTYTRNATFKNFEYYDIPEKAYGVQIRKGKNVVFDNFYFDVNSTFNFEPFRTRDSVKGFISDIKILKYKLK